MFAEISGLGLPAWVPLKAWLLMYAAQFRRGPIGINCGLWGSVGHVGKIRRCQSERDMKAVDGPQRHNECFRDCASFDVPAGGAVDEAKAGIVVLQAQRPAHHLG